MSPQNTVCSVTLYRNHRLFHCMVGLQCDNVTLCDKCYTVSHHLTPRDENLCWKYKRRITGIGWVHSVHGLPSCSTVHYSSGMVKNCTVQYMVQFWHSSTTVDLDTMHQLRHQTMPTVLLHLAGHCEHKITWILKFLKF